MLKNRPKIKAESMKSLKLFLKMALSTAFGNIIFIRGFLNPCFYMGVSMGVGGGLFGKQRTQGKKGCFI